MKGRTARRLRLMRYERWLFRNHPWTLVPPCVIREYNRRAIRFNARSGGEEGPK